uniref:Uncharacterized protein n=1 Tax=Ciona savignyi TaxID=51511 RepID=H2YN75_CIOSA
MMANEIMTEDQQEDMLWDQSLQVQQNVGNEVESDVGVEFYNKLPAYLYNGKVNPEAKVNQLGTGSYSPPHDPPTSKLGLKELSCDPLIGTDGPNTEIHYNKLPHYFSSGKLEPTPIQGESIQFGSSGQHPQGLVTSSKIKCTPHGALLNLDDTYYSRLPNYYNYGRPHVVGTVTEPPEIEDETVTSQSLLKADAKRQERRTERKRKASKKLPRVDNRVDGDRILYSKIPQYYLSGRKPLVPKRRTSEHSFSSSESSDEDYRGRTRR